MVYFMENSIQMDELGVGNLHRFVFLSHMCPNPYFSDVSMGWSANLQETMVLAVVNMGGSVKYPFYFATPKKDQPVQCPILKQW